MSLKEQLMTEVKTAMKAKEKVRLGTLRLVMAAIKQIEVDERIEVLEKMVKQRKDSIAQFGKANRQDLIDVEEAELVVIKQFLPEPMSEDELAGIVANAVSETGAESMKDMGKVMRALPAFFLFAVCKINLITQHFSPSRIYFFESTKALLCNFCITSLFCKPGSIQGDSVPVRR